VLRAYRPRLALVQESASPWWAPWWVVRPGSEPSSKSIMASSFFNSSLQQSDKISPTFFIVKLIDGSFSTVSPFLIHKTVQSVLGEVLSIKKLRSGDLLLEVNEKQASILSKCTTLGSFSVSVSPHGSLNQSRGVISEPDLFNCTEAEILEHTNDQNVINVRRITIRRDGKILNTKHLILTFNTPNLPTHIRAAYLRCPVRPYIPNPLRCFNCQRFGHSKVSCRGKQTCARCGVAGHESETCEATSRCINCQGDHPSYSRSCSKWTTEKEIQTIKITQKISFIEARKLVESRTPTVGKSYSAALSRTMKSIGTQTDPSQPVNVRPPKASPVRPSKECKNASTQVRETKKVLINAPSTNKSTVSTTSQVPPSTVIAQSQPSTTNHVSTISSTLVSSTLVLLRNLPNDLVFTVLKHNFFPLLSVYF
jgi:hypothetical protein